MRITARAFSRMVINMKWILILALVVCIAFAGLNGLN